MTGYSGLFKGTIGDLNHRANAEEKALLSELKEKRWAIAKQLVPIDAEIDAAYAKIRERLYGKGV